MKVPPLLLLATTLAQLALTSPAVAQELSTDLTPGKRHLAAFVGGSWFNKIGPVYSSIPTRPYGMVVGRAEYVLEQRGRLALSFYMEAIPAILVDEVPHYHYADLWMPPAGPMVREKVWDEPAVVYGAGLVPVGMQGYLQVTRRAHLFVGVSGGAAMFTRDMPVPDARKLNFLGDVGGGVRVERGGGIAWVAGIKFHHMSNANLGRQNPGIDGNVIYAGLSRAR